MAHLTTLGLIPSVKQEKKPISVYLLELLRGINENICNSILYIKTPCKVITIDNDVITITTWRGKKKGKVRTGKLKKEKKVKEK